MYTQNTTRDLKSNILNFLKTNCIGRPQAIKAGELAVMFGVGVREINESVRQLRLDGVLVGSSKEKPFGYYVPANEEEAKSYFDTYREELFDMLSVYNRQKRAQKKHLEEMHDQKCFEFNKEPTGQLAFV